MIQGWQPTTIDKLADIGRGRSKHRPRNDPALFGGEYPYVQTADIHNSDLYITSYSKKYSEFGMEQSRLFEPGTVCITNAGENTGDSAILGIKACFPDSIISLKPIEQLSDSYFLKYSIDMLRKRIRSITKGATQDNLSISKLVALEFLAPPYSVQKEIGSILRGYGELIENNKRRIELLEESARQLYKEWFVRFRFPGHEHVKIIDGVPEGWKTGCISDIAKIFSGYAFKSKDWLDEGNPVIKIKNITRNNTVDVTDCQCVDDNVAEKAAKFKLLAGDMLIAMTGATVGKVGLMPISERSFYLNQRVGKFESKLGRDATPLLLSFFNTEKAQSSILNLAGGAAQPNISAKQIESIELPIPSGTILNSFLDETEILFSLRLNLIAQTFRLTQARDLLLPKLMSGELAV
jgi:type I restriction enzyme S subunit